MDQQTNLGRIQIVLVDTQDGANIGSTCRAMKTMGITRLVLVGDREYDENRVRTLALHASDVWENAKRFSTLKEALSESVLTVAATRRRGKFRKSSALNPTQLSDVVQKTGEGLVSIVFGRESDGLTDEEVAMCAQVVTIPTSEQFPSLNLSQAVQIITFTLFDTIKTYPVQANPVTQARCEEAALKSSEALDSIGYFKLAQEKLWTFRFLRDVFERAALTESEIQKMEKVFVKMSRVKAHKEIEDDV
ncbi:MAG: RNA methyltransferase [Sphaerochaeta sp.]|jgi:tRNA/rRNA methyltransferase|uniref:RNA methyltransferase n=1 Tax=Sphaerochaeta sp. TaxID=1972642 RepID=UPI001E06B0B0|nr:RNA methyltransferase [Sphaerochaeta sp.]MDD3930110.1 RNA methyltransferase [Sphaerochaeta sp.]NCC13715.1 TrmJ/YjtD family RNA methyltransferase [Spirochaetia bacterium]NCC89425.1 TrmJ/YjtD family RNA methyltransferase [Spirochaetia bacterium]